ncbi:hypothetical protein KQI88_10825 [Alkaliphilus sp. MSJ-5]|uniref:Uncharacterized protein n=1 Tax=Alkaliphilus flagellatus TaxID=2841507 RepID=A0ABS6G338_9FIRM|nr:hypothetical protein [Alkaliphilus flagellatus]MBU5676910.1 hypothetical protein [Alkaliphilus flagellatus]
MKTNRLTKGKRYVVRRKESRSNDIKFCGILIETYERFYVFENENGFRECFLKVDIETNYYEVRKA